MNAKKVSLLIVSLVVIALVIWWAASHKRADSQASLSPAEDAKKLFEMQQKELSGANNQKMEEVHGKPAESK